MKGSKSITNRALLLSKITKFKLKNEADCEDSFFMKEGLKRLNKKEPGRVYLGNAGTAVRFLTSYAATLNKEVTITGSKRMRERPIKPLIDALKRLGADINCSKTGCPPVHIKPSLLKGGKLELPGDISSQYITSLLLISPLLKKGLTINLKGEVCSIPYIKMTVALLEKIGIKVETTKSFSRIRVKPGQSPKKIGELFVEGDASSASYLGAYAALRPEKTVTIRNIPTRSIQGDIAFIRHLRAMGCRITHKDETITIKGPANHTLKPLGEIDMNSTPDLVPTFAVLAAATGGKTRITNISNLKIKESNRIKALENELKKLGVKVKSGKDYIEIQGSALENFTTRSRAVRTTRNHAARATRSRAVRATRSRAVRTTRSRTTRGLRTVRIRTYNDHRIAMAFGVLKKTILPNLRIEKPSVVRKSYPEFWSDLNRLNKQTAWTQ